jgi:hypothetical protein
MRRHLRKSSFKRIPRELSGEIHSAEMVIYLFFSTFLALNNCTYFLRLRSIVRFEINC